MAMIEVAYTAKIRGTAIAVYAISTEDAATKAATDYYWDNSPRLYEIYGVRVNNDVFDVEVHTVARVLKGAR